MDIPSGVGHATDQRNPVKFTVGVYSLAEAAGRVSGASGPTCSTAVLTPCFTSLPPIHQSFAPLLLLVYAFTTNARVRNS